LRENQSGFSEMLTLKRPDVIPPVAPAIKEVVAEKDGISIIWYNSSSEDVVRHYISRITKSNGETQQIAKITMPAKPEKTSTYFDKDVESGETYMYQIVAEDDSQLLSPLSSPVLVKALGEKQEVMLKAKANSETITLTWTVDAKRNIEKVLIYRAINENPLRLLTNTTESSFTDRESAFGKTFKYRIKVMYEDGTTSDFSNEAKISL